MTADVTGVQVKGASGRVLTAKAMDAHNTVDAAGGREAGGVQRQEIGREAGAASAAEIGGGGRAAVMSVAPA